MATIGNSCFWLVDFYKTSHLKLLGQMNLNLVWSVSGTSSIKIALVVPICKQTKMNCELILTYDTPALRQTGSRNLTGPKTLPTIWHTYMKLVTKYQIPVINSCWEKCWGGGYTVLPLSVLLSFRPSKIFFIAFFSVTVDGRNLIFGHNHHIGIPYCGYN
jgi:hypothetical protein